jgi:hypothetical protein
MHPPLETPPDAILSQNGGIHGRAEVCQQLHALVLSFAVIQLVQGASGRCSVDVEMHLNEGNWNSSIVQELHVRVELVIRRSLEDGVADLVPRALQTSPGQLITDNIRLHC